MLAAVVPGRMAHWEVSINGGTPIAGWFISWKILENPMKVDDLGVPAV